MRLLFLVVITLVQCPNLFAKTAFTQPQTQQLLEARRLNQEVEMLSRERRYAEAIPRAERLVFILEGAFGPDDIAVGRLLNNLAGFYRQTGKYPQAELRYKRSLAIAEKRLGPNHQIVILCLGNLAGVYHLMGDYVRAEQLYKRTLTVAERAAAGEPSVDVATVLNTLAVFYSEKGDDEHAESFLQRAMTVAERLPRVDTNLAAALINLGHIHLRRMDYAKAKALFTRAMLLTEGITAGSQQFFISLDGLARVYESQGDFKQAQPLYERALIVAEKVLGSDHPATATALNNLGLLYMEQRDNERAQPILERALRTHEKRYGLDSIHLVSALINLSRISEDKGDIGRALILLKRSFNIREKTLRLVLITGSERQKRLYLATLSRETDGIVSMMVRAGPKNSELADLSLTTVLRRKGRALDAMSDQIGITRRRTGPRDAALLDELSNAKGQLAAILLNPTRNSDEEPQGYTATLEKRIEELEGHIAANSEEFQQELRLVTVNRVQSAIPPGAALVEIVSYRRFNASITLPLEKKFAEPLYLAFVLRPEGNAAWVELGDADFIDELVSQLRAALQNSKSLNAKTLGRALDEQVMEPIRTLLGDSRQILLSPDGELNLIPFGALVDKQNHYLIENYLITYLTSGRDLLRSPSPAGIHNRSLVIANPLFDGSAAIDGMSRQDSSSSAIARSIDFTKFKYPPLPGTALEAKEIAAVLTDAEVLTEARATESALKSALRPRFLHIATHGFFLEDQKGTGLGERGLVRERIALSLENPLLRSGLILAGVTQPNRGAGDDGVMSALETAALDLRGTQLVVLSACETGVGDIKVGEGVFGLRRALVLAGAESQVTSLWQVDDKTTRDLMVDFYTRLQRGEGRGEALRNAELTVMKTKGREHPYFWASFIEVGDWRSVNMN